MRIWWKPRCFNTANQFAWFSYSSRKISLNVAKSNGFTFWGRHGISRERTSAVVFVGEHNSLNFIVG
jgi:hypothetical protein